MKLMQIQAIILFSWFNLMCFAEGLCSQRMANWPNGTTVLDLLACSTNQYFPPIGSSEWEEAAAGDLGWSTALIPDLLAYLEAQNTRAFLVLKDGRIVLEHYWGLGLSGQNFNEDSYWYWASAGKTLTASLIGIAQDQGFLDIGEPASLYLGLGWTSLSESQETRILISNQLSMTSGLDDQVPDPYCTDPACLIYLAGPGTRWAYHNAPYTMLDGVIEAATATGFDSYFNANLRDPIGMNGFWAYSGYNHVYYSTARSMARFGLLILNEGIWDGNPVVADNPYVQAMIHSSQSINPSYGYLWWLNGQETFMLPGLEFSIQGPIAPDAPKDMFAAMGKNGQLINIVPSLGLVVIRMGDNPDQSPVPLVFQNDVWQFLSAIVCP